MDEARRRALRTLVLVANGTILVVAMLAAWALHQALRETVELLKAPPPLTAYLRLAYLMLPLWLVLNVVLGLDRAFERRRRLIWLVWDLAKLHALALAGLALLLFLTQMVMNRSLVAMLFATTFVLMLLVHGGLGAWLAYHRGRGFGRESWLLVGAATPEVRAFLDTASRDAYAPRLVGFLASPAELAGHAELPAQPLRHLGAPSDLAQILHEEAVDHVFFLPPHHRRESAEGLEHCENLGIPAHLWVDLAQAVRTPPRWLALYDRPFLSFTPAPKRPEALVIKHGLDLTAAALGLLVTAPLLLAIALAIRLTMGSPVLFVQERVGLAGRRFRLLKFRTMVHGAEARRAELEAANEMSGPVFKMRGDPRVTPLGRLLRRTSLDELPQLWNVLSGAMSLVGPRPLPVAEQQQIRGPERRRLAMRPGLTGLWQTSGRSDLDFEQWMKLDLLYVDTWSPALDFRILLRTIPVLLFGRGAR